MEDKYKNVILPASCNVTESLELSPNFSSLHCVNQERKKKRKANNSNMNAASNAFPSNVASFLLPREKEKMSCGRIRRQIKRQINVEEATL